MERVAEVFRKMDADGDGVIEEQELAQVLRLALPGFSDEQVQELIKGADLDENGVINYDEFIAWMFTGDWPDEECFALSIQLHDRADENFTGFVSVEEIMAVRQRLCERLGLGDLDSEAERERLSAQDCRAAGVDILKLNQWSSCMKAVCEAAGADAFKEAARRDLAEDVGEPRISVGPVIGLVEETTARILVEADRDIAVKCVLTQDGGEGPVKEQELELPRGRPAVFSFSDLAPGTRYVVTFDGAKVFTDSCSFRTVPETGWRLDRGDDPSFAIASCNKVYTSRGLPRASTADLWRELEIRIRNGERIDYMFHLGDNVYNDHEWYLVEKGKKKLEGLSCKWGVAATWLRELEPDLWESRRQDIDELFRTAYRETWGHAPTRFVLANLPNLMLFDDHDIRDDFGDREEDFDPNTLDRWLANIAYGIVNEYQRQLHEDLPEEVSTDFHHHVFGDIGVAFVDVRGCKTFHRIDGDSAPFLGKVQWRALEDAMTEAEGLFTTCKAMLMLMPVPIAYVTETPTMLAGKQVVDDLLGQWSATKHLPEVPRFLQLCAQWRSMGDDRQVLIVGGDVHEGGWTDIYQGDGSECLRQLTTSAIANKMTKPHEALAVTLTRSLASAYDGCELAGDWRITHYHWTNLRNCALLGCRAGSGEGEDGGRAVIQAQLITSDGLCVEQAETHSTAEAMHKGQLAHLMRDAQKELVHVAKNAVGSLAGKFKFKGLF